MDAKLIKQVVISIVILITTSCTVNSNNLKNSVFKYGNGYYLGDGITIDSLSNDTIYYKNNAIGILKESKKRVDGSVVITVKSVNSDSVRIYHEK